MERLFLFLLLFPAPQIHDEGVVETRYPGGELKERYEIDDKSLRDGKYESFREDGSIEVSASYRRDQLHGLYSEFGGGEALVLEARYDNGKRNGYWRTFKDDVRTLNSTYKNDVLNGRWQSLDLETGHHIAASYKRGKLDGSYKEVRPGEKWERSATYKNGLLHGKAKITVARKTTSKRTWDKGNLIQLDGRVPFPIQLDALVAELTEARVVASTSEDDSISGERMHALMRLKTYRALCRLPWRDIALVPEWNEMCDAAGEVCEANGKLDHSPEKPPEMDDERYQQGYKGANNSNLSAGGLMNAVDSFMDDSDPSNIDRIGHRRWCLNPLMGKTGFGASNRWSAMWALDSSKPTVKDLDAVFYPPPGYVPVDLFGPNHAWSIHILKGKTPRRGDEFEIEVVNLNDHYEPVGDPLELNWKDIAGGNYGQSPCIVFRPLGLRVRPGMRYAVKVSLDSGKTVAYEYLVEFVSAPN